MKKNLEISDFENKETKAGRAYARFKTNEGWMSCFDSTAIKEIKALVGRTASVEVTSSGDFQNIIKCYGEAKGEAEEKAEKSPVGKSKSFGAMYVSYAKDLVVSGKSYDEAVKIIQDLRKAFE